MVTFTRGKRTLLYRTSFDIELNFLTAGNMRESLQRGITRTYLHGIPQSKKDDILTKLGNLMPPNRLQFWKNLHTSNVDDLISVAET